MELGHGNPYIFISSKSLNYDEIHFSIYFKDSSSFLPFFPDLNVDLLLRR